MKLKRITTVLMVLVLLAGTASAEIISAPAPFSSTLRDSLQQPSLPEYSGFSYGSLLPEPKSKAIPGLQDLYPSVVRIQSIIESADISGNAARVDTPFLKDYREVSALVDDCVHHMRVPRSRSLEDASPFSISELGKNGRIPGPDQLVSPDED